MHQPAFKLSRPRSRSTLRSTLVAFTHWSCVLGIALALSGCSLLLRNTDIGTSEIVYSGGELLSQEETPFDDLFAASVAAIETLAYDALEQEREEGGKRGRIQARTARGEPVEIQLIRRGARSTELRIRVGMAGDEVRSRLVLEQIHRSL